MRVARRVVRTSRTVIRMMIEERCLACKLIDGDVFRIVLVDRAAVRLQMCQMTLANRIAAASDRRIVPIRALCQQETRAAATRAADLSFEEGVLRGKRCAEDATIPFKQHVTLDLGIALRRSSLQSVALFCSIDKRFAVVLEMHCFRIARSLHAAAADTNHAAIGRIEKIVLVLLDIDESRDLHERFLRGFSFCRDGSLLRAARFVANLDRVLLRIAVLDTDSRILLCGRSRVDAACRILVSPNADIDSAGFLDGEIRTDDADAHGTLRSIRVVLRMQRQRKRLHVDLAAARRTFTVHEYAAHVVAHMDETAAIRLGIQRERFVERIFPRRISLSRCLPSIAQSRRTRSDFGNLILLHDDRRLDAALPAGIFLEDDVFELLRCGRCCQTFGDHRLALEIALGSGRIIIELARQSVQRLVKLLLVCHLHILRIGSDRDLSTRLRTLDVRVARLVVRSIRAIVLMCVEELCFALELVDVDILRIVLVDCAAVRL